MPIIPHTGVELWLILVGGWDSRVGFDHRVDSNFGRLNAIASAILATGKQPVYGPEGLIHHLNCSMMKKVRIHLRVPQELRDETIRQAAASGISLNLFLVTALASRVKAQAEAKRRFSLGRSYVSPARAKELLQRLGAEGQVRDGDQIDGAGE